MRRRKLVCLSEVDKETGVTFFRFASATPFTSLSGSVLVYNLDIIVIFIVPGKVRIGRIDLRDNFSFFEVEEGEANRVMDSMNGFEVDGRRISVEPAQAKGEGGKGGRSPRGGSRGGNGFRDRRDSGRGGRDSRRESDRGDRGGRRSSRSDDKPKRKFYEDTPRSRKKRK